jgi:hypothetical protein
MRFGIASQSITPPVGVTLWGYNPRPSTWVEHSLRAEAIACEGGGGGWILVCADVGAFSGPLARVIRADVAAATGLPPEAVMITATHTHSGPHVTDALWCERSPLESAYFQDLRTKLTQVAQAAWQTRSPGELLHAQTMAPDVGANRRVQREDGTWTNEWSDPEGRHTGYYDPTVDLLAIRRENGELDALLINFGCHPVCYNSRNQGLSGDYVSYLKDALEAQGAAKTVLFTVSGHANIDPRDCVQNDAAVTRRVGEHLAEHVRAALPRLSPVAAGPAAASHEPWAFATNWAVSGRMDIYFPHAAAGSRVETLVSCIAVGDCALLGLPGETVSEYRGKFIRLSPFGITLLVSLANDFIGYLPTDEILDQGAYEADICPCRPIESALTEHAARVLAKTRNLQKENPA